MGTAMDYRALRVERVMNSRFVVIDNETPVEEVARRMVSRNTGFVSVIGNGKLVGVLTCGDLVRRVLARQNHPSGLVARDVMTPDVHTCVASVTVEKAAWTMGDHQVRQLPVLSFGGEVVGLISLDLLAEHISEELAGQVLGEIVERR